MSELTAGRAEALRQAFDRSFAEEPSAQAEAPEDLLAICVGGAPYAARVAQIAGLLVDKKITALPAPAPALIGLAGFRGGLVAVYDLRALLGYAAGAASRHILLAAGQAGVGLLFDGLDGYLRLSRESIAPAAQPLPYTREIARSPG